MRALGSCRNVIGRPVQFSCLGKNEPTVERAEVRFNRCLAGEASCYPNVTQSFAKCHQAACRGWWTET